MKGLKRNICFFTGMLFVMLLLSGFTEDGEADYDGWIFQTLPAACSLFEEDSAGQWSDGIEPLWDNFYKTRDEELLKELEDSGLLVYAEPDYWVELMRVPNDPCLLDGSQYSASMLGQEYTWNAGITGRNVRIGILDSGLYSEHEDLRGAQIIDGWNYCEGEDSTDTSDDIGHGTFAAGVIAAQVNNGLGVAGIAPEAEIVPLKCFTLTEDGKQTGKVSNIAKAIRSSVDDFHCDILNMSFGLLNQSNTLRTAISYAYERNVLMIAAVGNLSNSRPSTGNDPLMYPAAYAEVIGVGAVDQKKSVAPFSYQNESVFVTAPGREIIGLANTAPDGYASKSGTSFSTPAVTAAAALARSIDPSLSSEDFQRLLAATAEDLGAFGYDPVFGHGLLNIERLLLKLQNENEPESVYEYAKNLEPGTVASVYIAAYDENGRMTGFTTEPLEIGEDGTASVVTRFAEKADAFRVRFMILDGSCTPLCSAVSVK